MAIAIESGYVGTTYPQKNGPSRSGSHGRHESSVHALGTENPLLISHNYATLPRLGRLQGEGECLGYPVWSVSNEASGRPLTNAHSDGRKTKGSAEIYLGVSPFCLNVDTRCKQVQVC